MDIKHEPHEMPGDDEVYTVRETAERLKLTPSSAYLAISRGQIPSVRFGRQLRIPRRALERLLEGDSPRI